MEITVNGLKRNCSAPLSVGGLLRSLGIDPQSFIVERNLRIVVRTNMESELVQEGDIIEVIRLVGGG